MPIVPGCSKLRLVAFHLGHTPSGGSKVPCRFLSSDILCRSLISGFTGALHDQGWPGHSFSDGYWSVARSHGRELWFDTELGDE